MAKNPPSFNAAALSGERWRPVLGYEGIYEVSDMGRVRGMDRYIKQSTGFGGTYQRFQPSRLMANMLNSSGYPHVTLRDSGRRQQRLVHHLVLEAFVGPAPKGTVACHANDIPTDNRLSNLRWDTLSANTLDSVRNGTHPQARLGQCKNGHEFTPEEHASRERKSE